MIKNIPIGEVLKEYGYITDKQIEDALALQKENPGSRLGALLVDLGYVTDRQRLEALGKKLQCPLVDLDSAQIDNEAVALIPRQLASKYKLIAMQLRNDGTVLQVAVSDPLDFYGIEDIRQVTSRTLDIVLAEEKQIDEQIERRYAELEARRVAAEISSSVSFEDSISHSMDESDRDAPAVKLLNSLLVRGYTTNASDIHIEADEEYTNVRMRVDSMLIDYIHVPRALHQSLVVRTKILANLDIAEKRIPQDGHFHLTAEGCDMSMRVSVIPTVHGEKVVLRYLSTNTPIDRVGQFGMDRSSYERTVEMLQSPHGIIYITGPTGSGKTTTLYMMMEQMAKRPVNISSIEDPVERNIRGINQMQVNNMSGLTFERGLRSLLRQDPDIIMVGETRDDETASISVRAAITGHLVLSTLHTNDAASTVVRLADMNVQPYMIASSLVGAIAQRLVKKVCPNCAEEYTPTAPQELEALGEVSNPVLRRGRGCHHCNNTGYQGRIAVHEIMFVDRELRRMIGEGKSMDSIKDYAVTHGMVTLGDATRRLVLAGVTTMEELRRVTFYNK